MKQYIIIILVVISLQSKASDLDGWLFYSFTASAIGFTAINYFYYYTNVEKDGLYISFGLDPKMTIQGNFDIRAKSFYHYRNFELSMIYEHVGHPIYYEGVSLGLDRMIINKKLSWLAGIETSRIWDIKQGYEKNYQSIGINTELRFSINNRWSISYTGNIKTRNLQNKNVVYSSYISANLRL